MVSELVLNHPAYRYATDITNNKYIAGKYVIKSCEQFLNDIHDPDSKWTIDEEMLQKIMIFTEYINMPTGHKVGISAKEALSDFQWYFMFNVLCWVHKDDTTQRRYEKAVLLIARKNGKSFLTALLILLLMLLGPKHSKFFSVAPTKDLSSIVKRQVDEIIDASPRIGKYFKPIKTNTMLIEKNSTFEPLATSDNKMDGREATAFIADEVGALKNRYPISAMESSQMNVKNRLGILISTAYQSLHNPMTEEVEYAEKVINGEIEDELLFALLYKPDNEDEWLSDEAIYQANPLVYDLQSNWDYLIKQREKAKNMESEQSNYKTKHVNIFVDGDIAEVYVATPDLRKGRLQLNSYKWRGADVYVGVDLSQTTDNTSVSMVTYDKEIEAYVCKVWAFLPANGVETKNQLENVNYFHARDMGYCFFSGDRVINHSDVEKFVMNLEDVYGVNVKGIGYDRYHAIASANRWVDAGFEATEVKQYSSHLAAPTKLLKECILTGRFYYEQNQLFEQNVANAKEVKDSMLNGYINKKRSNGKVDMLAATINAMFLWNNELEQGESVLNIRGGALEISMG
ncbi:terminase large subunit [Bacillus toyonensis]|uniref:terminase large subunit n=1 Tax=Bacillus toyonensis TaxID=155322 RepID=UPI0021CEBC88|nr:terminase TerL endonuclease subunit [Bacillus toyonensis]MCU5578877.1 terminase large subunit [Bacillus toyonensis]